MMLFTGGRVDMFHVSEEHMISGIFIKHVLEDSPAGRNGTLKTGDRILQVLYLNCSFNIFLVPEVIGILVVKPTSGSMYVQASVC